MILIEFMSLRTCVEPALRCLSAITVLALLSLTAGQRSAAAQDASQINCHEIAIIGALSKPGRINIQERIALADALARVGGPTAYAGKSVRVIRPCKCSPCTEAEVKERDGREYNLSEALSARDSANPFLFGGDIVIVPQAEVVIVRGNVYRPVSVVFREGTTLSRVIAIAGGVSRNSDLVKTRIHRKQLDDGKSNSFVIDLKSALANPSQDPLLQPWDVIEISDEAGRFLPPLRHHMFDPPLTRPGDPQLFARNSLNC